MLVDDWWLYMHAFAFIGSSLWGSDGVGGRRRRQVFPCSVTAVQELFLCVKASLAAMSQACFSRIHLDVAAPSV